MTARVAAGGAAPPAPATPRPALRLRPRDAQPWRLACAGPPPREVVPQRHRPAARRQPGRPPGCGTGPARARGQTAARPTPAPAQGPHLGDSVMRRAGNTLQHPDNPVPLCSPGRARRRTRAQTRCVPTSTRTRRGACAHGSPCRVGKATRCRPRPCAWWLRHGFTCGPPACARRPQCAGRRAGAARPGRPPPPGTPPRLPACSAPRPSPWPASPSAAPRPGCATQGLGGRVASTVERAQSADREIESCAGRLAHVLVSHSLTWWSWPPDTKSPVSWGYHATADTM